MNTVGARKASKNRHPVCKQHRANMASTSALLPPARVWGKQRRQLNLAERKCPVPSSAIDGSPPPEPPSERSAASVSARSSAASATAKDSGMYVASTGSGGRGSGCRRRSPSCRAACDHSTASVPAPAPNDAGAPETAGSDGRLWVNNTESAARPGFLVAWRHAAPRRLSGRVAGHARSDPSEQERVSTPILNQTAPKARRPFLPE
jgi:hypothetical protein